MSRFVLAYDIDRQEEVLGLVRQMKGVTVTTQPAANGTVEIVTRFATLDDETAAIHAIEDIRGVIDLRLLGR